MTSSLHFFSSVPAQNTDAPFKIEPENKTVKDTDLGTSITGRFSHFILVYLLVLNKMAFQDVLIQNLSFYHSVAFG